jgi:hypothetical protein
MLSIFLFYESNETKLSDSLGCFTFRTLFLMNVDCIVPCGLGAYSWLLLLDVLALNFSHWHGNEV